MSFLGRIYSSWGWKARLINAVDILHKADNPALRFDQLMDMVKPISVRSFIFETSSLVAQGRLSVGYQVISPQTNQDLGMYRRFIDIPEKIIDDQLGEHVKIHKFRDVHVWYGASESSFDYLDVEV